MRYNYVQIILITREYLISYNCVSALLKMHLHESVITNVQYTQSSCHKIFVLFCFVLRHINLIGHLIPNQVLKNKSEKKFKGEVLGINDKL